ncbi:hypothetical protein [Paraburkholderia panacisoli]|uniref:hypothetical protein n=1 Tax=Paraburkholderia panacisoli TaxID=2603818 RepID=UPI001FE89E62|nr:hypothetical protein [Paraburkholderia panacisoli]
MQPLVQLDERQWQAEAGRRSGVKNANALGRRRLTEYGDDGRWASRGRQGAQSSDQCAVTLGIECRGNDGVEHFLRRQQDAVWQVLGTLQAMHAFLKRIEEPR